MRLVRQGKVKDIYELEDGRIVFHFSDRVSAFDVKMPTPIPRKGEVLCKFGKFWFDSLDTKHHMLDVNEKDEMTVMPLKMIPMECVVRGYFYGSFVDRYQNLLGNVLPNDFEPVLASRLPFPIFDPTTKSEEHDIPVSRKDVENSGLVSTQDYDYLQELSITLYKRMSKIVEKAGFFIADVKFEFGRGRDGEIVLGDSLGPDEYRLWLKEDYLPGKMQASYDKQLLRDWLVETGFKEKVDQLAKEGKKPSPPEIDPDIVNELSRRYVFAYERIAGRKL
jgi:phosphoribosylaminoimidazole-succinocarboxamide synthase